MGGVKSWDINPTDPKVSRVSRSGRDIPGRNINVPMPLPVFLLLETGSLYVLNLSIYTRLVSTLQPVCAS